MRPGEYTSLAKYLPRQDRGAYDPALSVIFEILCANFTGLAGSVLEARLNRTDAPAWYCSKKSDQWRLLWLSLEEAARPVCLLDEMAVFFNETTGL